MASTTAIATCGLTKRYGGRSGVEALQMEVPAGTVTGFVGPNGAGKTTTIRMLLGLMRPTAGTAYVLGHPLAEASRYLERVGSLVDGPAFHPRLSGRDNLRVLERLAGATGGIDAALDLTGLTARAGDPVATYSLGMRQRLALAAALLPRPELVILDEPANGLDPAGIREIRQLLRRLADEHVTVFVSSHQLSELEQVSDQLVLLRDGRLRWQGPLRQLLQQRAAQITARPQQPGQCRALVDVARAQGWHARTAGDEVTVSAPADAAATLNQLAHAHGITLAELRTRPPSLEEVFFWLTGTGQAPA
jgi:ABC-2 type transport system ATP-binding protein